MFTITIADKDVTDKLIGTPITIRHSSDHPFFSDTEISDVTFDLFSDDSEFDPLKPKNWFTDNWDRIQDQTEDNKWNQTGYRCPVTMTYFVKPDDPLVVFNGVIVNIMPDPTTSSVTVTATDASYQLRETQMSLTDFGVPRYLSVNEPDKEDVYRLPPTASPVSANTVRARHVDAVVVSDPPKVEEDNPKGELERVDSLEDANRDPCKRLSDNPSFVVHPSVPSIQTDRELSDSAVSVSFREPHRWVRVDAISKKIIEAADIQIRETEPQPPKDGNAIKIDIPEFYFRTPNMEYASRGRVGWHTEHTDGTIEGGVANNRWGWTGFVRDFVVNPENGDTFFLYAHRRYANQSSIIHYDYAEDTYTRYRVDLDKETPPQSLWRIATTDFQKFYVLSTAFPTEDAGYEFGHNYNAATPRPTQPDSDKPRIISWDLNNTGHNKGWSDETYREPENRVPPPPPPQLANYFYSRNDAGGGVNNWWADTRTFFGGFSFGEPDSKINYIGFRYQTSAEQGFAFRTEIGAYHRRPVPPAKSELCSDFCIDEEVGSVYALTVTAADGNGDGDGDLVIHKMDSLSHQFVEEERFPHEAQSSNTTFKTSDNLSVSDVVLHKHGSMIDIYCVLQFDRGESFGPGAQLLRLRNSQGSEAWKLEVLITYNYYVASASGGVVADDKVYYFEGNVELYGNRGHRSGLNTGQMCPGSVVDVSGDTPKYYGVSRISAYSKDITNYDYGAHVGIIAPLRWDGQQLHMITGYGDVSRHTAFDSDLTQVYNESGYLEDEPQEDIQNWHWITLGRRHSLYIEKLELSEKVNAWSLLKRLAELVHARLYYEGETLHIKHRSVFEIKDKDLLLGYVHDEDSASKLLGYVRDGDTARAQTQGNYLDVINADNYTADDNLIDIDIQPTYTQLFNQIRGNITYTVAGALPNTPDERDILSENKDSLKYIGNKPLDVDVSVLTHHQLWWAKIIASRLLKHLAELKFDISVKLIWLPRARVGDLLRIDIRSPKWDKDRYTWMDDGHLSSTGPQFLDAEIIEVEHTLSVDAAWETHLTARTFPTEMPTEVADDDGSMELPETATDQPDRDANTQETWSGFALVDESDLDIARRGDAYVISNDSNKLYHYHFPNTLVKTYNLDEGEWVDIAYSGGKTYLLEATTGSSKVKEVEITSETPEDLPFTDRVTLPDDEWLGLTVKDANIYVLGKVEGYEGDEHPHPDFKVYVFSTSGTEQPDEEKDIMLDANYSAMAFNGEPNDSELNFLIGDAGIRAWIDISLETEKLTEDSIIEGSVGWIGLDYSSVSERQGWYALQENGSRILAFTGKLTGVRNHTRDFRL